MADLTGDDPFTKGSYTAPIHIFGFLVKQAYSLQFIKSHTIWGAAPGYVERALQAQSVIFPSAKKTNKAHGVTHEAQSLD